MAQAARKLMAQGEKKSENGLANISNGLSKIP